MFFNFMLVWHSSLMILAHKTHMKSIIVDEAYMLTLAKHRYANSVYSPWSIPRNIARSHAHNITATNFVQFCLPMLKQIWTKSTQLAYCLKRHLSLSAWMSPSKGLPIGTSNRFDQQLYECIHLWYDHCQWIHCWHYPTFFSCQCFDPTILET